MLMDKAQAGRYVQEDRYPLPLRPAMPDVWELWQRSKTLEWDPQTDIPWAELPVKVAAREHRSTILQPATTPSIRTGRAEHWARGGLRILLPGLRTRA